MNAWSHFFYAEFGASRAYLLCRALLIMLALDVWRLMIGHAGRYGIDGFNVAHFGWLDAIQPLPSAASYIAVLLLTGLLALSLALTELRRGPALALFVLYTFSWSMSMLDSYQHHYFVSLVLLCLAFFPQSRAQDIHPLAAERANPSRAARAELYGWLYVASLVTIVSAYVGIDSSDHPWVAFACFAGASALATWFYTPAAAAPPARTAGWGYPLLGASVAIVYAFTALAKVDANWMQGHTLLRISAAEQVFAPLADLGEQLGLSRAQVWSWLSTAVIPQELTLGCCYLIAIPQDRTRSRWPRIVSALGFVLAVVLHVGAEAMDLQIGWFSYYMLLLASCYLLPLPVVDRLATVFTWPARHLTRWAARQTPSDPGAHTTTSIAVTAAACVWLALVATRVDLPGAASACGIAALALCAATAWALLRKPAADPRRYPLAACVAAASMWLAIAASPARWDFYRYLGGDLRRRGELDAALTAYQRGEAYAPPGASRAKQIAEIRHELAQRGKPSKPSSQPARTE